MHRDNIKVPTYTPTVVIVSEYVPLQKLIYENELIVLATQAALSDEEYYVQATALECLAAAAKIESLWREVVKHNASIYVSTSIRLRLHSRTYHAT